MTWLKNSLSLAQEWALLVVGAPVALWGVLVASRKLLKLMATAYEGGLFLIDVKEHIGAIRTEMQAGFAKIDRGQLHMIQSRRVLLDRETSSAFFECDPQGGCQWVSRQWKRMTGLDEDEARGNGWEMGIAADERAYIVAAWKEAIDRKRPFEQTVTYVNREGVRTAMKVFASPIIDEETGDVLSFFGHLMK